MMEVDPVIRVQQALSGKRVLVTGHTGFKGAWLAAWLNSFGAIVGGFALAPDEDQQLLFSLVNDLVDFSIDTTGDIRDEVAIDAVVGEFVPDVVFHLAAQPLVRYSYKEPLETFDVNVTGTAVVLDAVRKHKVPVVVCITTDKCYENLEQVWPYRETDPMGGWDPYSASKGAAELVVQSYRRSYFDEAGVTACASARAGNVVGGGDLSADRLIPDVYRAMSTGEPVVLRSPSAVRPWQHVLESLSGYLTLAAALVESGTAAAGAWNFGPDPSERVTVGEFVKTFAQELGAAAPKIEVHQDGPHEAHLLSLDISKAAAYLNWRPVLSTSERAAFTAAWMVRQHDGTLAADYLVDQIADFEARWRTQTSSTADDIGGQ